MENKNSKIPIILPFIVLVISLGVVLFSFVKNQSCKIGDDETMAKNPSSTPVIPLTKIYFVGDIMLTRGVQSSVNKNFNENFNELFKNVTQLKEADMLFGNLEGPISSVGNNVGSKYSFRMNPLVLSSLKEVGFNIFSFANNHIGDWNVSAFNDTLSLLRENGIFFTGAGANKEEVEKPTIVTKNGINFGFLGFSDVGPKWMEAKEDKGGILLADNPNFSSIITKAKESVDVLIVSIHFGEEYEKVHNKKQEKIAHLAIDSGADMIIGHHPHVIQDVEYYQGKPIFYSLGNFIFDQYFSKETMKGLVVMATFEGNILKEIKSLTSLQNKKYQIVGLFDDKEIKDVEELIYSNCPQPDEDYTDMALLNIGQEIGLSTKNYVPKKLVDLGVLATNKNFCLTLETKRALELMLEDASSINLKIKVTSAFRDYAYQENIFNNALLHLKDPLIAVAKPGHSEHQLGTTVDLSGASINFSSAISSFDNTPEELWLRDNAYKYGFIMSYPYGKENITGYKYEPWHYRYVGIDLAKKITESELTIVEYLK
jgi:poly-gamma-glutamate synthesis protein (capsule biosynthesis protein)